MTTEKSSLATVFENFKTELENAPATSRFSEDEFEAIYSLGYQNLKQGAYDKALKIFSFLTIYQPTCKKFLMGMGLSHQFLRQYDEAIQLFSLLGSFHADTPEATLHVAQCLLAKGDTQGARDTLYLVIDFCKENKGYEIIGKHAEGLFSLLNSKLSH